MNSVVQLGTIYLLLYCELLVHWTFLRGIWQPWRKFITRRKAHHHAIILCLIKINSNVRGCPFMFNVRNPPFSCGCLFKKICSLNRNISAWEYRKKEYYPSLSPPWQVAQVFTPFNYSFFIVCHWELQHATKNLKYRRVIVLHSVKDIKFLDRYNPSLTFISSPSHPLPPLTN